MFRKLGGFRRLRISNMVEVLLGVGGFGRSLRVRKMGVVLVRGVAMCNWGYLAENAGSFTNDRSAFVSSMVIANEVASYLGLRSSCRKDSWEASFTRSVRRVAVVPVVWSHDWPTAACV